MLREQCGGGVGFLSSGDKAGPCARGSLFLGHSDAGGTQLKAIMSFYLKNILPAFSSFPRDLPTLPDPWRLLSSTGGPTSPQQI